MRGLELSRTFFLEHGLPLLEKEAVECMPYIAIGMAGGSQCHGHDDDISRDHGWGPGFAIWIKSEHLDNLFNKLDQLVNKLPKSYAGFKCLNYGVLDFERYVESVVGVKAAPVSPYEWMRIPESALYEITNRPVFLDESGFATACFLSFQRYPQDVLNKRLSACLYLMWEWGVKQLKRAEQRDDILASQMYWSRFVEYVIKILFLMNKKYAPYHKWLYKVTQQLPYLVLDILPLIFMGAQLEKRFDIVMDICQKLSEELGKAGYSKYTSKRPSVYSDATEILEYAAGIRSSIKDDEIRAMHILQEIATPPTRPATTHVGIK